MVNPQVASPNTLGSRLRQLKRVPPELIPVGMVVAVAVGLAGYSLTNSIFRDRTLRLSRQNRNH
ncbi:hypothetical protein EDC01DRAFT_651608 [Geopyxis carbonaria]|nr:hypothetical protein EDC01DRAFT_651608 [Geopyxis carbonaria]